MLGCWALEYRPTGFDIRDKIKFSTGLSTVFRKPERFTSTAERVHLPNTLRMSKFVFISGQTELSAFHHDQGRQLKLSRSEEADVMCIVVLVLVRVVMSTVVCLVYLMSKYEP
ncbi:hypothetical protein RRG08_064739 [Elysia crispata]|uniref:Uncharacterized protein n=1 Tax=Elysia crispata TaxID=231223 RepID=A0AAE0YZD7_9GAST|nr:hypothetical protein RRG08_064739 [Elysia crispata]